MSAVQIGDVFRLCEFAWQVYHFGWSPDFRASDQYVGFFEVVRSFADNLSILTRVVQGAQQSLTDHGARPAVHPRWHLESLFDIVGDYETTLRECHKLIDDNTRFSETTGVGRNLQWNYIVQPAVDRLQERLVLHNSRLLNALKPFEVDLLTRVHEDIARRIDFVYREVVDVRQELRELIGVLVPSLAEALERRSRREVNTVPIPNELLPELVSVFDQHAHPSLRDMADAFIRCYDQSTKTFTPGLTVEQRTPPTFEYISLLKCQFLMQKIRASDQLRNAPPLSHWRGYIDALEETLSDECWRFRRDMVAPDISSRTDDMLGLWSEEESASVFDVYNRELVMEDLMEAPLVADHPSHRKTLRLLRHTGTRDRHYRIVTTVNIASQRNPHRSVVDFDITSCVLNPVYASPGAEHAPSEIILEVDRTSRALRIIFVHREDLFKFQQALTGFLVIDGYAEYAVKASFVGETSVPVIVDTSVQLWMPRRLEGTLVTENANVQASVDNASLRTPSLRRPSVITQRLSESYTTPRAGPIPEPQFSPVNWGSLVTDSTLSRTSTLGASSPGGIGINWSSLGTDSTPSRTSTLSASSPGGIGINSNLLFAQTAGPVTPPHTPRPPAARNRASTATLGSARGGLTPDPWPATRPHSITPSTRSSGSDHTTTVSVIGGGGTGLIHTQPLQPLLVLFTKDAATGAHTLAVVLIDAATEANSERCNCRVHPDACAITALERAPAAGAVGGRARALSARRLASPGGTWDLLRLAARRRHETGPEGFAGAEWRGLRRVSLLFRHPAARLHFGGRWCECRRRTEGEELACLQRGDLGLLGQVRVWHRRQMAAWHRRLENNVEVVNRRGTGLGYEV